VLDGNNTLMNGFRLEDVTGVLIEGFTVRRYHDDIWLQNADQNEIRRNRTSEAWDHDGIVVTGGSDGNNVHHNVSFNNTRPIGCGMSVGGGSRDNRFHHNRTYGNVNAGILLGGGLLGPAGPGNVIAHNRIVDNPGHGILNAITGGSRIRHNYIRHNGFRTDRPGHGIFLSGIGTTGVVVAHNRIRTSMLDGISLASADTNTLARNHSQANGRDGIRLDAASDGNIIRRNHMRRNTEHDAHDENRPANTWTQNHCSTDFPSGTIC
jgi:parallel beta-helix repeat protein